jgi:hypothetical protein
MKMVRDSFVVLTLVAVPLCGSFCGEDDAAPVLDGGLDARVEAPDAEVIDVSFADVDVLDAAIEDAEVGVPDSGEPRVFFVKPVDGDVIATQTVFSFDVEGFELVPAHRVTGALAGHLHLFVDAPCVSPGEVITSEPGVVYELDEGQKTAFVVLSVGIHTLCLQAGTSEHVALPIRDAIAVDVR